MNYTSNATITLYECPSETNVIGKDKTKKVGPFKTIMSTPVDIMGFSFEIPYLTNSTPAFASDKDINYMGIIFKNDENGIIKDKTYYYFVDNIGFTNHNTIRLQCSLDVLETYKDEILDLKCVIDKAENKFKLYLPNNDIKVQANAKTAIINFDYEFNQYQNVMLVAGSSYDTVTDTVTSEV